MTLRTLDGTYFNSSLAKPWQVLKYRNLGSVISVYHSEGSFEGGDLRTIHGNFSIFQPNDNLRIEFGGIEVLSIESRNKTDIVVKTPP